jgi:hypothetical protein
MLSSTFWLLKWVYANWLLFKEEDIPRSAIKGMGASWSVHWLSMQGTAGKWDWKTFNKGGAADNNIISAVSSNSAPSRAEHCVCIYGYMGPIPIPSGLEGTV